MINALIESLAFSSEVVWRPQQLSLLDKPRVNQSPWHPKVSRSVYGKVGSICKNKYWYRNVHTMTHLRLPNAELTRPIIEDSSTTHTREQNRLIARRTLFAISTKWHYLLYLTLNDRKYSSRAGSASKKLATNDFAFLPCCHC